MNGFKTRSNSKIETAIETAHSNIKPISNFSVLFSGKLKVFSQIDGDLDNVIKFHSLKLFYLLNLIFMFIFYNPYLPKCMY